MKTLVVGLIVFSFFVIDSRWTIVNEAEASTVDTTNNVFFLTEYYSKKYNVSEGLLDFIIKHESSYNPLAVGDTHLKCPRTGEYMRSRGLSQISNCFHDISDSDAFNPRFAIEFLAKNVAEGRCLSWWSTCRIFHKKYPLVLD